MKYKFIPIILFVVIGSCKEQNTSVAESALEGAEQPNVLFVLVDDLGYHDLSFAGSAYYETPNIDQLASKSTIFTQGYAGSRVCSPSRATIMTGKFTARHGITDWIGAKTGADWRSHNRHDKLLPAENLAALPANDSTIAETLKANGYKTFYAGKWHLGDLGSSPEDHGFEINKGGWESGSPKGGYFAPFKNPKLEDNELGENLSIRLAKETVQFMQQEKEKPFFAFLSFYAVHGPIQTSQEKWKKYRDKAHDMGIQDSGFVMEKKLPIRQVQDNPIYAGLVESMDDAVGIVLEALKTSGLDKNTMVIFTSDNGGVSSGDNFSTSNLPHRGGKGYQWEGGIREPFLVYVPWLDSEVKTIETPVTAADIYPTILDFANLNLLPNQHLDGMSLKPLMQGSSQLPERPLYWHYPHYGNQGGDPSSIIRKGKWKLIHYYENNSNELYDLELDPFEQINLANSFPDVSENLYTALKTWLTEVDAKYPVVDVEFDTEKRKKYEEFVKTKKLAALENERKKMLQSDFSPNKDWWGSKITID